jgi:hypothetical protein
MSGFTYHLDGAWLGIDKAQLGSLRILWCSLNIE